MTNPLVLPRELTIYSVGELRPHWLAWLADAAQGGDDCCVDGAAVDEVDSAGVQLLLSLAHSAARERHRLQLRNPSAPLAEACKFLGAMPALQAGGPAPATGHQP